MTMFRFQSTKLYEGFSTVFRQWRAEGTHCSYLHGYGISFKLWFEGELDHRNWVWDFGGFGRTSGRIDGMTPKQWFSYMFDHTVIVAEDDPHLPELTRLEDLGLVQLRVVQAVGAEQFARLLYEKLNPLVEQETNGRVRVTRVEFREHERNSAIFEPA
jgi:6-pyruvoyltetrahydropterin/6-carboxytetrahydropterin synthase